MADAANTPDDKEPPSSAAEAGSEKDEAKAESAKTVAAEADNAAPELVEAPPAPTKLVAPDAVPAAAPPDAVQAPPKHETHAHDHSGDGHGHSHDDHDAHGDDDHPVATDIIAEKSWQDTLLTGLSLAVALSFAGLVFFWYTTVPLAEVTPEEAPPGAMQQH